MPCCHRPPDTVHIHHSAGKFPGHDYNCRTFLNLPVFIIIAYCDCGICIKYSLHRFPNENSVEYWKHNCCQWQVKMRESWHSFHMQYITGWVLTACFKFLPKHHHEVRKSKHPHGLHTSLPCCPAHDWHLANMFSLLFLPWLCVWGECIIILLAHGKGLALVLMRA